MPLDGQKKSVKGSIDPGLPVAKVGSNLPGENLPYYPSYKDLNPRERATFLNWLADGRSDSRIGPAYIFLYFYGLERRFFLDEPSIEERNLLVTEVKRLLDVYGDNRSVKRHLENFLDATQIILEPKGVAEPQFRRFGHELPLGLRVAIGRMAKERKPISADWLLGWFIAHPETRLRTPAKRAFPEFKALFTLLFEERFPDGLKLRVPKRLIRASYASASGGFEVELKRFIGDIPDVSGAFEPLRIAGELVAEATGQLEQFSRFLGRNPDGRNTIEGHALLPESLWPLFPAKEMEDLRAWADGIFQTGGMCLVEQVIERLEGMPPEKISKRQLTGAADALARLSIGMAPDPRFALRSPKLGEPVVLFRLPEGITALEDVSEGYKNILVTIAMGSFIAHTDGEIATKERAALEARVGAIELSAAERARLIANLQWMLTIPPDLALIRRRLRDAPDKTRHELGQVAIALAAEDGVIDPGEIKAIERLYKALGLPTDGIYTDLHVLVAEDEPVTVRPSGQTTANYDIPMPPVQNETVVLDAGRVDSLINDTARVSVFLADIFRDEETKEELEESREEGSGGFHGLDSAHAAFLGELLTRERWEESEFAILAGQFRLMQDGALETVNEWAFEHFSDLLIEEDDGYDVNADVVTELRNKGMTDAETTN